MNIRRVLIILCSVFFMVNGAAFGIDFFDDFNDPTTYMLPVNENTKWRQVGVDSGTFSIDVGSDGTGNSVRLVDAEPGFFIPALGANNAQYYDLSNVIVQAEIRPNNQAGNGGVGFGVYDDSGENLCGGIAAALNYYVSYSSWNLSIGYYDPYNGTLIFDWAFVNINPNKFYRITMTGYNDIITATLATLDGVEICTLSGTPNVPIDVSGIGMYTNGGDFSFDNFSFTAEPDTRHMVFHDVELVTDTTADELSPAWSPDGKKLAYIKRDDTVQSAWNVWVQPIDPPGSAIQCTKNTDQVNILNTLNFSPDSQYVFFQSYNGGNSEIKKAKVLEDSDSIEMEVTTILADPGIMWFPHDVSNTRNLLFGMKGAYAYMSAHNLFCVEIEQDGTLKPETEKMLTDFPAAIPWTDDPVGVNYDEVHNRLVFVRHLSTTEADIYVLNGVQEIIDGITLPPTSFSDSRLILIATGPNYQTKPQFSGDGSFVYYTEDVNGTFDPTYWQNNPGLSASEMLSGQHWEIFAVNPDALEERFKLNYYRPYNQGGLDASPDGTKIVFNSDNRDDNDGVIDGDIYIVTLKTKEEIVADIGGQISDGSGSTLDIPADALSEDTTVSIKTPVPGDIPSPETLPYEYIALAREIDTESDTATILPDTVKLIIHYTDEEISGLDELSLQIYVYNEDTLSWEALENCIVYPDENKIEVLLPHLSMFCVSGITLVQILTDTLPEGAVGSSYNASLIASEGDAPYTWALSSGNLPNGLSLNELSGEIYGVPSTEGIFTFTVQVTDDNLNTNEKDLSIEVVIIDFDEDGYPGDIDCDDGDPTVNPGEMEIPYNGKDDDCNELTPDDDLDGDGYQKEIDCDDTDPLVNPGMNELPYNGKDDDCDSSTKDDDLDNDGYPIASDCDDTNPALNPDTIWFKDADGDGYSDGTTTTQCERPAGSFLASELIATSGDCNDTDQTINPGMSEVCDGFDNNCDGNIDEGFDQDGDGYTTCNGDCDDTNPSINPGAEEVCNGLDDNCNGLIDEGVYMFGGFQQPINADGSSIFKAGRTIPVKITITDCGGVSISNATVTIQVFKISNSILGTEEELEVESSGNANTDNLFRYNETDGQYIYNLSTKDYTAGTYQIYVNLDNGDRHSIQFSLK